MHAPSMSYVDPLGVADKEDIINMLKEDIVLDRVDPYIIPYLHRLNACPGCVTVWSCAGHAGPKWDRGYLTLRLDHDINRLMCVLYAMPGINVHPDSPYRYETSFTDIALSPFTPYYLGIYAVKNLMIHYMETITSTVETYFGVMDDGRTMP